MVFSVKQSNSRGTLRSSELEDTAYQFRAIGFDVLEPIFTRGQFWPSGIVIACVCGSVCPCVCV